MNIVISFASFRLFIPYSPSDKQFFNTILPNMGKKATLFTQNDEKTNEMTLWIIYNKEISTPFLWQKHVTASQDGFCK